jgi:hypothetical protein
VLGNGSFQVVEQLLKNYSASYIRDNLAIVHIFFNENAYSGFTKNELIGFTEFLSNTGGLLGKLTQLLIFFDYSNELNLWKKYHKPHMSIKFSIFI